MRHAARVIALCYAALVTVGPVVHATQERSSPVAAVEESHSQACTPSHDPATCPVAGLSRTPTPEHRPPRVPEPPVLREVPRPEIARYSPRILHDPKQATGPPSLVLG